MRIAILGYHQSFGLDRIGGTDSFFRRLARNWIAAGHEVTFVIYGAPSCRATDEGFFGIRLREFRRFPEALGCLEASVDAVIVNTLHRNDRLRFAGFRFRHRHRLKCAIVYSLFREAPLRRHIYFLESILAPYQDGTWCMSPRLVEALGTWVHNASLVWPPVGREFYCSPQEKPSSEKIRLTYIGRTERGKGIRTVIDILQRFRGDQRFQINVHAYNFPGDTEANSYNEWLRGQDWLDYHHREISAWSPEVDLQLAQHLRTTDILLLPYERLSSSIDTPLLLTEGMAASCCVITRPFGNIPRIYGESRCLIGNGHFAGDAEQLIHSAATWLPEERSRVFRQAQQLAFDESSMAAWGLHLLDGRNPQ